MKRHELNSTKLNTRIERLELNRSDLCALDTLSGVVLKPMPCRIECSVWSIVTSGPSSRVSRYRELIGQGHDCDPQSNSDVD